MNRTSAASMLGVCGLGLGGATVAGVIALSTPASAADYPPVITTTTTVGAVSTTKPFSVAVLGESTSKAAAVTVSDPNGSGDLPFTGADVAGISIVGVALVGGGTFLMVAGRRRRGAHR